MSVKNSVDEIIFPASKMEQNYLKKKKREIRFLSENSNIFPFHKTEWPSFLYVPQEQDE